MNIHEPLVDLSVRYRGVLFPFRLESLAEALPHLGFVVHEGVQRQFGARLVVSGPVAVKGDLRLHVSVERLTLGIRGHEHEAVVREFEAVEELLQQRLRFASPDQAAFYEVQAQLLLDAAGKVPITETQRHFESLPSIAQFGSILARPATNFGFRLVPPGVSPNSPTWFDIRIEPDVFQSDRFYFVHLLFRDPSRTDILNVARRGRALAEELIQVVESRR